MDRKNIRVLIVDDEEMLRQLWGEAFSDKEYSLYYGSCGNDGIEIIKNNQIDIVITDLKMPGSDGYVLLDFLQKEYKEEDLLVYVCSGYVDEAVLLTDKYNITRIINKPFSLTKEIEMIEESIAKKRGTLAV
jgi:DNA-binding NtrC family response regulator